MHMVTPRVASESKGIFSYLSGIYCEEYVCGLTADEVDQRAKEWNRLR